MSLKETIEKASKAAGSQKALAEKLNVSEQNLSGFKTGSRYCGYKKQAQIAAIAGEDPTRVILEAMAADLDENDETQKGAKVMIQAMLDAFPRS